MPDSEHNTSLADDPFLNTLLLLAASSLALALTACLWHHFYSAHPAIPRPLPLSTHPPSLPPVSLAPEEKDRKSTRSKERRRRGKDPFRDLLKAGKKSKALKAVKAADSDLSPPSVDMSPHPSVHGNDDSSTSRSQSPEPPAHALALDRRTHSLGFESDDGCSVKDTVPSADTSSTSAVPSSGDISDYNLSDACSLADSTRPPSCPPPMTAVDTPANVPCPATVTAHAPEAAPSFPHVPTPQPCDLQTASASGRCVQLVRARTRLRASKIDSIVKSSSATIDSVAGSSQIIPPCPLLSISASTRSSDGAGPSTPTNARLSASPPRSLSLSQDAGHREPISPPTEEVLTAQAQLASMRDALEAARRREEQLRIEAERANKEREQLCWRWNKDAGVWRCREAELQAHIHHLTQQLQTYAAMATFQAQQQASNLPSSGFSSPTSPHAHPSPRLQHHAAFPLPPAIRVQNSASPPAHVQALLASTPMLISHPLGFAAPPSASGGAYPGAGLGTSPLLWSGMASCVPNRDPRQTPRTPDSSSRGRRRRCHAENVQNASDESSLGDWDGMGDGSEGEDLWEAEVEEEEDVFSNNALADAILKRPESIRDLSASARKRSGVGRGQRQGMAALKDPATDPPLVDMAAVAQ